MRALVFSVDNNFVEPFEVLFASLMRTSSIPDGTPIIILHTNHLSSESKARLKTLVVSQHRTPDFIDVAENLIANFPISENDHVSKATYYRLFLASLLPVEIESAVYLDVDTVVIRSIKDLFDLELTNPVAATDHMAPEECFRMWGPSIGRYFQAGVLVVDLKIWRYQNYEKKFSEIITSSDLRIKWWDQDILNIAFEDNWQTLPVWYNAGQHARQALGPQEVLSNAYIIHYDGNRKPWQHYSESPYNQLWYDAFLKAVGHDFKERALKGQSLVARFEGYLGAIRKKVRRLRRAL